MRERFKRLAAVPCRLAPELPGRAPVGRPEQAAEVLRPGQAPARRDREDRLVRKRGIEQVEPAVIEPGRADPAADARPLRLEELVEIPPGDEARPRDLFRVQLGISEVRLDERLDGEEDLGPRPECSRFAGRGRDAVEASDQVDHALDDPRLVARLDRAVLERDGQLRQQPRSRPAEPGLARDRHGGEAVDVRGVRAQQRPRHPNDDRLEGLAAQRIAGCEVSLLITSPVRATPLRPCWAELICRGRSPRGRCTPGLPPRPRGTSGIIVFAAAAILKTWSGPSS